MSVKNKILLDAIIIGSGPAGMSAAIYLARKGLRAFVIGTVVGGQTALSGEVDNYLGFHLIKGSELGEQFHEHAKTFSNLKHLHNVKVTKVEKLDNGFQVIVGTDQIYRARTLIIASGREPRELGVPGEKKLKNKGVTYCAICDAPLFQGKTVAVVGGGNSALDAAIQLLNFSPQIYIVNINEELGGDTIMRDTLEKSSKVKIINKSRILEILGDNFVKGMRVNVGGEDKTLNVEGIFIEIGSTPSIDFLPSVIALNEWKEVIIDKRNMTNVPGIFAAGDVTDVLEKQTIVAAGEGAKAAIQVSEYLNKAS